jgi:DNA-binding MarR family transcriptional regulator
LQGAKKASSLYQAFVHSEIKAASPLNEIFRAKDKKSKDQVRYEAHLQYGYTLKEIAEYIDLHYSTVSRAIKKIEGKDEK